MRAGPLNIASIDDSGNGLVRAQATFPPGVNPTGQDWLPAALAVSLDRVFLAVITAAPPAPADWGWIIARPGLAKKAARRPTANLGTRWALQRA